MQLVELKFGLQKICFTNTISAIERMWKVTERISQLILEKRIDSSNIFPVIMNNFNDQFNFQTEHTAPFSIIDGNCFGYINDVVPTNYGRQIDGRTQESISIPDNVPVYYPYSHQIAYPYGWSYPTTFVYPYAQSVFNMPVVANSSHSYPTVFQANSQNQNIPTNHILSNNSHRRYFHRHRDITKDNQRQQDNNTDIMSLRFWEKIEHRTSKNPGFIFTLMSYNVLAQDLIEQHPYLYREHNQSALQWNSRWRNLLTEIKKINPDILCLQEVQKSHMGSYYSQLEILGYRGLYKKRTGEQSDGCAIYFKDDYIDLIEHTTVEFRQKDVRVLDRDNVGIIVKLAPKLYPTQEFIVATTHLLYNPKRDDVRLAQMQLLLTEMERLSYKKNTNNGDASYLPVILTGDFNSPPQSILYKFVTQNKLNYDKLSPRLFENLILATANVGITDKCQHADLLEERKTKEKLTRFEELELIDINHSELGKIGGSYNVVGKSNLLRSGTLSHKFELKSVYNHGGDKYSEATTHQDEWLTVDYIFYSVHNTINRDKMTLLARYRLPTGEELGNSKIPNTTMGSDHLSLIAKFKLEF